MKAQVAALLLTASSLSFAELSYFAEVDLEHQYHAGNIYDKVGCSRYGSETVCTGRNPRVEFTLGAEYLLGTVKTRFFGNVHFIIKGGVKHRSTLLEGSPFNDRSETSTDQVFVGFKIGGICF